MMTIVYSQSATGLGESPGIPCYLLWRSPIRGLHEQ